jgi:hypothetical protein
MFERKLEDEGSFFASNREKSRQWSQKTNRPTHISTYPHINISTYPHIHISKFPDPGERMDAMMR